MLAAAVMAAAAAAVWVYSAFDPAASAWFPKCTFKLLTGYDCPGCGSQRALHALLGGDIGGAWRANAAFVVALPLIALLAAVRLWPTRLPRLARFLGSQAFILVIAAAVVAWWIGRNAILT